MPRMNNILSWALSQESHPDGKAQVVDANNVKSHIDISDADKNDLSDKEDTETLHRTDGGDEVKVDDKHDIVGSIEDYEAGVVSDAAGAKTIDAYAVDERSNAPKRFVISGFDASTNPAAEAGDNLNACVILIQNGPLPEVGVNGVTAEDLLTVVAELYTSYQEGPFACEENAEALEHIQAAQAAIAKRFARREAEGTEGTYTGN